ncbi:MAG: VOC family protein [Methanobacteriaceae archaeon]
MIEPYIVFNGNCEEAMKLYEKVFKSNDSEIMRYSDAPEDPDFLITDEMKNLVLHGEMTIDGTVFNFSDTYEEYIPGNIMSIAVKLDSEEEIKRIFNELKEGATIHMDIEPTFFSPMYGVLTDRFGLNWQLVCIKE